MNSDQTGEPDAGAFSRDALVGDAVRDEERRRLIAEIASDETMPVADRQARLEALAAEWGLPSEAEAVDDPFRQQIARALSLLAEGGHV